MLKTLIKFNFGSGGRRIKSLNTRRAVSGEQWLQELEGVSSKQHNTMKSGFDAALRSERFIRAKRHNIKGFSYHCVPHKTYSRAKIHRFGN